MGISKSEALIQISEKISIDKMGKPAWNIRVTNRKKIGFFTNTGVRCIHYKGYRILIKHISYYLNTGKVIIPMLFYIDGNKDNNLYSNLSEIKIDALEEERKYKNIYFSNPNNRWSYQLTGKGIRIHCGGFLTQDDAYNSLILTNEYKELVERREGKTFRKLKLEQIKEAKKIKFSKRNSERKRKENEGINKIVSKVSNMGLYRIRFKELSKEDVESKLEVIVASIINKMSFNL